MELIVSQSQLPVRRIDVLIIYLSETTLPGLVMWSHLNLIMTLTRVKCSLLIMTLTMIAAEDVVLEVTRCQQLEEITQRFLINNMISVVNFLVYPHNQLLRCSFLF